MKIVCASSVSFGREAFSTLGDVILVPEEEITRDVLKNADALITRSKTKIVPGLLDDTSVTFVGCTVAGTDHIDPDYLAARDVAWTAAPGCNANSVAEYVVTALLLLAQRHGRLLSEMTLGVIGVGHIGSRVVEKAMDLGMCVLQNDPPRKLADNEPELIELDEVLAEADIVTLHVPLTNKGPYATRQMVDYTFFEQLKPGALFFNAARGEIMDSDAVALALDRGSVLHAVLDVWENEPAIRKDMVDRADMATPHIAGYSYEGLINGTAMIYEECCHFFEVEPTWATDDALEKTALPERTLDARGRLDQEVLLELCHGVYDLTADDRRFRAGVSDDAKKMARHFVHYRRNYPVRREFAASRVHLLNASNALKNQARALGFQVSVE